MYDLIVIGAGVVGSATAYQSAKAGHRVLLLEQYAIDHQRGSSHGYSRIIRYAYDHPTYIALAKAAFPAWSAFEEDAGETFYVRSGGIDLSHPGEPLFVKMLDSLAEMEIPYEILSTDELRALFPQFTPDSDMVALYQKDAGVIRASKAVQAFVRRARELGADVRDQMPVLGIRPVADGVEVQTASETFSASRVVVASGGWLRPMLLPLGLDLPLQPIAAQENYLTPLGDLSEFTADRFPVWIAHVQAQYGNILYGLPSIDGSGVKIGLHSGPPLDPASPDRVPDTRLAQAMLDFARHAIPQAAGAVASSRVCIYTLTPDEHFIIDRHPDYPQVIIASCCSGHGFKFGPTLGQILSDLAFDQEVTQDLRLFGLSRFDKIRA
jgi:monomeric sarcosine oxidase